MTMGTFELTPWLLLYIPLGMLALIAVLGLGAILLIKFLSPNKQSGKKVVETTATNSKVSVVKNYIFSWTGLGVIVASILLGLILYKFLDQTVQALPYILLIAGIVLIYGKMKGGWILLVLAGLIAFFSPVHIAEFGNNLGQGAVELSRKLQESGPLPTTGNLAISRKYGDLKVFALADNWRKAVQPPGTELCADPIEKIEMRGDSTPAVKYFRSLRRGETVHVYFYFMPYGHSCVLRDSAPDPNVPPERHTNRRAHESERGGFSFA